MPFATLARTALLALASTLAIACGGDEGDMSSAADSGGGAGASGSSAGAGSPVTAGGSSGGAASASNGGSGGGRLDPQGGAPTGVASGRHTARPIGSKAGNTAGYWEYLPPHYGNGARYPLLVFRHGIGENGNGTTELQKVVVHGPPKLIEADQWPESRNWIVLSVQHGGGGCAPPRETHDFLEFALANYDVDTTRVYLTGLSCGAIGSWDYLGEHTNEKVAAAVLICGNGRPAFAKAGCNLGKVPIWAFHGEADQTVEPEGSTEAVASLQACTAPPAVDVKLTTYPGVAHDSWTMTYQVSNPENDIYAWLESHRK